ALDQGDLRPARVQVLRDIVTAVAGTDDDGAPALPRLAVLVLAGMNDGPGKIPQGRDVRNARDAAHAGCEHYVPRMELALRAVRAAHHDRPALRLIVVHAALEIGAGPVIELHAFRVGLEPVGELVLRDVDRPARRKGHVRQVIDVYLVVQR